MLTPSRWEGLIQACWGRGLLSGPERVRVVPMQTPVGCSVALLSTPAAAAWGCCSDAALSPGSFAGAAWSLCSEK